MRDVDLVVCALPGHLGHDALAAVLAAGRSCVDISFSPEDPRSLASLAEARGLTAIDDCGVMPGLGGMLAVHLASKVKRAERASILVGGLPVLRRRPLEYRASFSPVDVIEEYTRPWHPAQKTAIRTSMVFITLPLLLPERLLEFTMRFC